MSRLHRAKTSAHRSRGARCCSGTATLPELAIALCVSALLLGVAIPAMGSWVTSMRMSDLSNTLLFDLYLARGEAIKRNARVTMCKSVDGRFCSTEGGWEQGRIIFADSNNNGQREAFEPLIHYQATLPPGWVVTGNTSVRDRVGYGPEGMTRMESGAFQAGTLTVCRRSTRSGETRQIVISSSGRPRMQKAMGDSCP